MIAQRRRDGVIAIGRRRRWPLVCHGIAAGLLVLLPLALSLALLLPPLAFAAPPLTLAFGTWILLRTLDRSELQSAEGIDRPSNVIPLPPSSRGRRVRSSTQPHR
jgi:hypothetical protein